MVRTNTASAQILLFPLTPKQDDTPDTGSRKHVPVESMVTPRGSSVVLCGTYRKDPQGLRRTFDNLTELGFSVLSPSNTNIETEKDGFVYMRHETTQSPEQLEKKHLDAIQKADFVWLFAPDGYVGPTGSLEVGFAHANGIPVYSDTPVDDITIKQFVRIVDSPMTVHDQFRRNQVLPPPPAIKSFQHYYRQVALQRGYSKENARDCLLLMVEEVGELARALRKKAKLLRYGKMIDNQEALELADVFIYVVHMANILKVDLSKVVQEKELINIKKLINAE